MAIIENIINVLVPLLICGLIFIYFRRKITNLEQSIDIIMKMLQTNQLNSGVGTINDNHSVKPELDDVYVPSNNNEEIKKVEMNLEEMNKSDTESEESESEESESEESESEESENEDSESQSEDSGEKQNESLEIEEENTTSIEDLASLLTPQDEVEHTNVQETKKVVLSESLSHEELEKKTLNELKKMLKDKIPDINKLSRMNKATVIENLMQ